MFEKKFYWYRLAVCPEIGKSGVKERERERERWFRQEHGHFILLMEQLIIY